jgi:diadenylate cyclase
MRGSTERRALVGDHRRMQTPIVMFISALSLRVRLADILDIAVITVCLYLILLWLKQRTSRAVAVGMVGIACLYILARLFGMYLTSQLFQVGLTAILVALVLVFQEDIRRGFARLATWQPFQSDSRPLAASHTPDTLVESASMLAGHKIGALIVLKGREELERHIHGGVTVDGAISLPLLCSIFHPQSPGHDGAVLIEADRIEKFGVHLPLSTNLGEIGLAGTRHTAALGLAERSDALVIVVSEERGTISVAERGRLAPIDSLATLMERLQRFYQQAAPPATESARFSWLTQNIGSKLAALVLASLLWLSFAYRTETVQRTFTVPIEYRNLAANLTIDDPMPTEARVILSGLDRAFNFDPNTLVISLDLSGIQEGSAEVVITEESLRRPPHLTVQRIEPQVVRLRVHRLLDAELPVHVPVTGSLPDHLKLLGVKPEPATVRVRLQRSKSREVTALQTEPLNLAEIRQSTTVRLKLILPESVQLPKGGQATVRATIEVAEQAPLHK